MTGKSKYAPAVRDLRRMFRHNRRLSLDEQIAHFTVWLDSQSWPRLGTIILSPTKAPDPAVPDGLDERDLDEVELLRWMLDGATEKVFAELFTGRRQTLEGFILWYLGWVRPHTAFFTKPLVGWAQYQALFRAPSVWLALQVEVAARAVGISIPDSLAVPEMPFLDESPEPIPRRRIGAQPRSVRKKSVRRHDDQSFRYVVWAQAGYMGGADMDDPVVQPTGLWDGWEARRLTATMNRSCHQHIDKQARIIESNDDLHWGEPEIWRVVKVKLPFAVAWAETSHDPFAAMGTILAGQAERDGTSLDDAVEAFVARCEFEVEGGSYDGTGYRGDGNYDQAMTEFAKSCLNRASS